MGAYGILELADLEHILGQNTWNKECLLWLSRTTKHNSLKRWK